MLVTMLMGGRSKRFLDKGYTIEKAFLPMPSKNRCEETLMVISSLDDLPMTHSDTLLWVVRKEHRSHKEFEQLTKVSSHFHILEEITNGQATSAFLALQNQSPKTDVLIAGCDCGMIASKDTFDRLKKKADVIIFTYKGQQSILEKPHQHSYLEILGDGRVQNVLLKETPKRDILKHPVIISTFWFKSVELYQNLYSDLTLKKEMVRGEYYIDSMIKIACEKGLNVYSFEVDYAFDYGTPEKYENYMKTQEYFNKFYEKLCKEI